MSDDVVILVNIVSSNGLLPFVTKPLPELIKQTYYQLIPQEQNPVEFKAK